MALTFVATIEAVSADLNLGFVVDATVYGSPNPARNELALILLLFKRDVNQVDTAISVDNTSPLTVNQWSFTLPTPDGIFVGLFYGILLWQAGTYANLSVVYYNGVFYRSDKSTSGTPGISADWDVVTDYQSVFTGNSTVQQSQVYMFSAARAQAGPLGDALSDLGPSIKDGRCKDWQSAAAVITGGALIESAYACFRRADYINAQAIMDYVDATTSFTI